MQTEFTREQVDAIAALACLELEPDQIEMFARQLGAILAYAAQVRQIDTSGVPPTAHVTSGGASFDRPDVIGPCLPLDDVLANAPEADRAGGFFLVPRVIG